jgi:hypothetical protein
VARRIAPSILVIAATLMSLLGAGATAGAEVANVSLPVNVTVFSRTSLRVSTDLLRFDVAAPDAQASVIVDFSAAARTARDGELVLSVEAAGVNPDGAPELPVTFVGQGDGTRSGTLHATRTSVAARWTGSGLRTGSLIFSVRVAAPGQYIVPVRFVLSTP